MLKETLWGIASAQTYYKGKLLKGVICFAVDCNFAHKCWGQEINNKTSNRKSVTEDVSHPPMAWSNDVATLNMAYMFCEICSQNK